MGEIYIKITAIGKILQLQTIRTHWIYQCKPEAKEKQILKSSKQICDIKKGNGYQKWQEISINKWVWVQIYLISKYSDKQN